MRIFLRWKGEEKTMRKELRVLVVIPALVFGFLTLTQASLASDYPNHPIKMIV
jgi:hypothetical protein